MYVEVYLCLSRGKVVYILKWAGKPCMQPFQYYEDYDFVIN